MTYEEASEYMLQLNKRGIHPGLEGIKKLCDALGNPEKNLKVIHVAGTNGKGSTSMFLSMILRAAGLKVGVYSSPAVFNDREIIKVNGREITKEVYSSYVSKIEKANTFGCTRFEVETVMAFMFFKDRECDVSILEAGMGGLLDATNVVSSCLECVFTPIGLDHTSYLGDTIEKITDNKTGVIKPGSIVVSACQVPQAEKVIRKKAELSDCPCFFTDSLGLTNVKYRLSGTSFDYKEYKKLEILLLSTYQPMNAATAVEAALALSQKGIIVKESHIRKALSTASIPGRFEKISDKPLFYIDGAHNEPASEKFKETVETYFTKKKIIYIMGMLRDKDCETVVKNTAGLASCIFTVATPNKERTLSAFELAEIVKPYNNVVSSLDSVEEAVEMACLMADKDTVIIAFGSLSHLSKIKGAVERRVKFSDDHGVK